MARSYTNRLSLAKKWREPRILDRFYRIPADDRDLNYSKYFTEGEFRISHAEDYTSHNAARLNVDEVVKLLVELDYIQRELHIPRLPASVADAMR